MAQSSVVYAEPYNQRFVDGTRRFIKGASWADWLIAALFAPLFAFLVVSDVQAALLWQRVLSEGLETEAQIINLYTSTGGGRSRTTYYHVVYDYVVASSRYEKDETVSSASYNAFAIGDMVDVFYLRENPREARLSASLQGIDIPWGVPVYAGLFLLVAGNPSIREWQRRRYSQQGQLLNGTLITAGGRNAGRSGFQVTYQYRVRSPLGVDLIGKRTVQRNDLRKQPMPENGSPVKVLYIDDQHHRLL
jgi:hypothetical protein